VIISLLYEKTLVRYMKNYLDEHLLTELSMETIRFRFLTGFPNATIEITNAELLSGKDFSSADFNASYADTLLRAKSILFKFDLLKLLKKEYELKKIAIVGGDINFLFDKNNRSNLQIWKSGESVGKNYSINLRNIEVGSLSVRVKSMAQHYDLVATAQKLNFKGNLDQAVLAGETRGMVRIRYFKVKEKLLSKDASLQIALDNLRYGKNRFEISGGTLQFNKAIISVNGAYQGGKGSTIDLQLSIPKFGLDELMSLVPEGTTFQTGNFSFNGNGRLSLTLKGPIANLNHLLIRSDFELVNCIARNSANRETLHDINLRGSASGTNAANFSLRIDTISAILGKGTVNGMFTLTNLNLLTFVTRIHSVTDLKALKDFASLDTIEHMKGIVRSDFTAKGSFKRFSDSSALALDFLEKGSFVFEDVGIKLKSLPMSFEQISGKALWDKTVSIDSLTLKMNETTLKLEGTIEHLSDYLIHHGTLKSKLKITTDNLDISKYINQPKSSRSSTGYKSLSVFPENMVMNASVYAGNFISGKFKASKVSLQMSARKDSVYCNNVSMQFPDGSITGNALITIDAKHQFTLNCTARPNKINIQELFQAFNNFSQNFILDRNMKGQLEGSMNFYAQWDSTLRLIPSSMKAAGDFQIYNGELLDFAPMLKLSKYISVDELKHIRFSTLKNTIYISDRVVSIPEMAINSTAFNISISGKHSFDNQFDYRMNVLLSEVLFNKARKKKKEIDEFLIEESADEQTTIPLVVAGTPDNFDVKLDKKRAFRLTGNKLKNSTNSVKPAKDNFNVEWEQPEELVKPKAEPDQKEEQKDIQVEWDD
jgi:hypothetical protein